MQTPPPTPPVLWHGLSPEMWVGLFTLVAIVIGPILAVQVDRFLQQRREERARKLRIFRELMITRSTRLSLRHVEALNGIQMEFSEKNKKEKQVLNAWEIYMNHLNSFPTDKKFEDAWATRSTELMVDLLHEMAVALGYDLTKVNIKRDVYSPRYFADIENEQAELRKAAVAVFKGEQPLKIDYREEPPRNEMPRIGGRY